MATTVPAVELPTEGRYQAVYDMIAAAHDAIERLVWDLEPLRSEAFADEPAPPARPVTAADVGLLWSFVHDAELTLDNMREQIRRLRGCLVELDSLRLANPHRERGSEAA